MGYDGILRGRRPHATLLLVRPRRGSGVIVVLQCVAAATTTVLTFTVLMLARVLWQTPTTEQLYQVLAVAIVGLLCVPLITLGTATARLAARSRDDRLATLRLLGATAGRVRRIAVAEVTVTAAIGVAVGSALSALLPFGLGLIWIQGAPITADSLWLPLWTVAVIPPTMVAVASASALSGLRRVIISPLGVRMRAQAPRLSRARMVIAVAVLAGALLVTQFLSPDWGVIVMVSALAAAVLAVMAILGVVGPLAVSMVAGIRARRAPDADRLIAARGVQDDPRAAWRGVSTLALATFIAIPVGSLLGYLDTISRSERRKILTAEQLMLFTDVRTLLVAIVALSFIVVACQVALTQTAEVHERRELSQALDRIGMPRAALNRARLRRVMMPAHIAVIGAAFASGLLFFPLVGVTIAVAPLFIAAIACALALGLLLIRAGVLVTGPALARVLDPRGARSREGQPPPRPHGVG